MTEPKVMNYKLVVLCCVAAFANYSRGVTAGAPYENTLTHVKMIIHIPHPVAPPPSIIENFGADLPDH